jgi:hypothetical protein
VTRYEIWKFLHVIFAMIWVGGAIIFQILSTRAAGTPDAGRIGQIALWFGTRVFMPASILVLGLGILMVVDGPWEWEDVWINVGMLGLIVSVIIGAGFITPNGRRLLQAVAERGPQDPEAQKRMRRQKILTRVVLVILLFMVFDMVVKPWS